MYNNEEIYMAVMFPYPSGSGLHIGHTYNYAIMDSWCRYKRYLGHTVFQPFGYDSFGLPAENYAKKVNRDPKDVTYENIGKFREQMIRMNTKYKTLLVTSDPSYQKWTQWLFTKLLEHGLAYKKDGDVNYCTSCETVLAREQVKDECCERCGTKIEIRQMNQWYFKITAYKDRLIKNLDTIDYPKSTINAQRMWLENLHDWCVSRQRKWGCPIPVEGETDTMDTFVDSSFYFIRYCDPENNEELCNKDKYKQVDVYVGGNEHACMHLIYARFINMFLFDIGVIGCEEPFKKVIHQGMILNEGEKMSKTKGNVVNPDDYNPDELRFYLMFIGHYFDGGSWSDKNLVGIQRFNKRFTEWMTRTGEDVIDIEAFKKKIFGYTDSFKFNKVVSEFMTLVNNERKKNLTPQMRTELVNLLGIYMPGFPWYIYNLTKPGRDILKEGKEI
jgi:leucyl-tRNA synthetase